MKKIQAIRGFNDILPQDTYKWQYLESKIKSILDFYSYDEVRLPYLEKSELFHRSVGESSDIVSKETYDFLDRNSDSLTLRPEGTAGCLRMAIQNNLISRGQTQKLWYLGPMFRYERPQKGRYRQFYQLGVEAYGFTGLGIDLEIISIGMRLFKELGISDYITLEINNLGSIQSREKYTKTLLSYLEPFKEKLDADSIKRLTTNPLRIFDSKVEQTQQILENAPKLVDYIDEESKEQLQKICEFLDTSKVNYIINKNLVRGLDYYSGIVFEWTTTKLGSQSAICAGGRYDCLVETLGGGASYAIGFAIGMERLLLLLDELKLIPFQDNSIDVFFIVDKQFAVESISFIESIKNNLYGKNIKIDFDLKLGSFKSQFKKVDKLNAKLAVVIGQDEIENKTAIIKDLENRTQSNISFNSICENILSHF